MAGHFVPRSDGSSDLGTAEKAFGTLYAKAGNIAGELIVGSIKKADGSEIGGGAAAAAVSIEDTAGNFTSDNVEGALAELATKADTSALSDRVTAIEPQEITVDGQTFTATPIAGGYIWVG